MDIPKATVGIVSGGIRNEEHLEVAHEMRKKCDILIALGTCATHGGIPALINKFTNKELFDRYYSTESTDPGDHAVPSKGLSPCWTGAMPWTSRSKWTSMLPGCPPHPDQIATAILALLKGETPELPFRSVCDTCPTRREGKGNSAA
jgi:F420-non-reducing hydrogenase small subunit